MQVVAEDVLDAVRYTLDTFGLTEQFIRMQRHEKVPIVSGIYFLFDGDEVVYIGKSTNIHNRLNSHEHDRQKKWDSFTFLEVEGIFSGALESIFIGSYRPRYNKAGL